MQSPEQSVDTKESTPVDEGPDTETTIDENIDSTLVPEGVAQCVKLKKELTKAKTNREREGEGYSGSEDSDSNQNELQGVKIPKERRSYYESTEKYRKTLRLSSAQIVCIFKWVYTYVYRKARTMCLLNHAVGLHFVFHFYL